MTAQDLINRYPDAKAAGLVLWTGDGRILIGLQRRQGKWSEPGGKRLPGESVIACAQRELREEAELMEVDLSPASKCKQAAAASDNNLNVETALIVKKNNKGVQEASPMEKKIG